jgi:signal transduction histidine kinase/DNA-binding response OmpR family regulator/DNA-binding LacI/PurR family transcriptional regulator
VGLLIPDTYEWITRKLWAGAEASARQRGANLICFVGDRLHEPPHPANVIYDLVGRESLDCLVIWADFLGSEVGPAPVADLCVRYGSLPTVSVRVPVAGLPSVQVDQRPLVRALVDHLIDVHDCRRFVFVGPHEVHEPSKDACRKLAERLTERGLGLKPEHVMYLEDVLARGDQSTARGFHDLNRRYDVTTYTSNAMGVLLDERRLVPGVDFDAVVTSCANASIAVMQTLQERGIQVPGQVAVVGITDTEATQAFDPPLTVAQMPWEELGAKAVEVALNQAAGREVEDCVLVAGELIVRQSCGCISPPVAEVKEAVPTIRAARPGQDAREHLRNNKPQVLTDMVQPLVRQGLSAQVAAERAGRVLDAFRAAIAAPAQGYTASSDAFVRVLEQALQSGKGTADASAWHGALSVLRKSVLQVPAGDVELLKRAEDLFQEARTAIGEATKRAQMWQRLQAKQEAEAIRQAGAALATTATVEQVAEALEKWLPRLGIQRCYLSIYVDPTSPTEQARLLFAYGQGARIEPDKQARLFAPRSLVPDDLLPRSRFSLVASPLYFGNESFGFVLFDAQPQSGAVYEALRVQVSCGLMGAILNQRAGQAQQEAEEANRLKSLFLSNVSHELRTPLSIIVARTEMLLQELPAYQPALPESIRDELELIRVTSRQLDHLLGDVLDLGRGQVGRLTLAQVPLPLSEVIEQVAVAGERMARDKGLAWRTELPERLPWVNGDAARLRQVILNLLSNAVKFTDQGEVVLRVEVGAEEAVVRVSDTGLGIPPGECEQIFDEFRQSSRTAGKRAYGGIGLGLAITRRLVEMHGGRIWATSAGERGGGTVFSFTLPTRPEPPLRLSADRESTVLLVTERAGQGTRVRQHLEAQGFAVEETGMADVKDWLGHVLGAPPGAVVLDIEPATERGWELMRALKAHPHTHDVPVVFYTLLEQQRSGSVLALDYLTKPATPEALTRALDRQGMACDASQTCTVLVVDDAPLIVDLHAQIVRQRLPHSRVLAAQNGREALAIMAQERPDLVLLDLMMPEMDGFAVLEAMREQESLRDVPVIVLTAQNLSPQAMERLSSGVAAVLMKGLFSEKETLAHVEAVLSRSRRLGSETQRLVRRAMAYIHEHYAEPITRQDIAQYVAVSEEYLSKCYRQEVGVTLVAYVNRYRLKRAKDLLEQGEKSVTEIALEVGFSSPSYFSRVFRQEVGITPSAYQQGRRPTDV